jgi:hypothetical protein
MSSRLRALPAGFIAPCLPTSAPRPPSGKPWLDEINHDGFPPIKVQSFRFARDFHRSGGQPGTHL